VVFTGFEPFAHPDLPRLIAEAVSLGFQRIRLRTDGVALAQRDNAAGALNAGVRHLEVVTLGATAATHDALAGHPGHLVAARQGVAAFRDAADAAGVEVFVSGIVTVCRHNVAELPDIVASLADIGVRAVCLDACTLKRTDERDALLLAALETATLNRVAACVTGWPVLPPLPYDRAPWVVTEVPA
jgi:MoaA/NifB/PqqE/SkfB family radical SAM enzyme